MPILPAEHEPRVALTDYPERRPVVRVCAHAVADRRRIGREGQITGKNAEARSAAMGRVWVSLPAPRKVVLAKHRTMQAGSAALFGTTWPHGNRSLRSFGGVSTMSRHPGSKWRSYQAAYSSTTGRVRDAR